MKHKSNRYRKNLNKAIGLGSAVLVAGSTLYGLTSGISSPSWRKLDPSLGQFLEIKDSAYINPNQVEENIIPYYTLPTTENPFKLGSVLNENNEEVTYTLNPESMGEYGIGQEVSLFGEFTVLGPNSMELFKIRHGQYLVGGTASSPELGIRVIPVEDNQTAEGSAIMDRYLRFKMGLKETDKIFAPIAYFHPEYTKSTISDFASNHRLDDGFTHMGGYIGLGQTRNAPYNYHGQKWGMNGSYPAQVISVKYEGAKDTDGKVSQAVFNTNAYISLKLLNETGSNVRFSRLDYEKDYFDANNLKALMDFYRGWLDPEWIRSDEDKNLNGDPKPFSEIIASDLKYDTYCAEHITMAINMAVNLSQTKEGYIELFGSDSDQEKLGSAKQFNDAKKGGEYFFKLAQKRWQDDIGEEWPELNGTLTPLWKMGRSDGSQLLHPNAISELGIAAGDKIEPGQAPLISEVGFSLAWAPQTLPDMVSDLIALYGRLDSYANKLNIPGKEKPLTDYEIPAPIAGVLAQNGVDKVKPGTVAPMKLLLGLYSSVADRVKFTATPDNNDAEMMGFIKLVMPILVKMAKFGEQMEAGKTEQNQAVYNQYTKSVKSDLEKIRSEKVYNLKVASNDFFYYTPPTVISRIVQGNHRHNRYLKFEIVGTAIDMYQAKVDSNSPMSATNSNYVLNGSVDSVVQPEVTTPEVDTNRENIDNAEEARNSHPERTEKPRRAGNNH